KVRRETMEEAARQHAAMPQTPPAQSMGGMNQMSQQDIEKMVSDRIQKHQQDLTSQIQQNAQDQEARRIVGEFSNKIEAGKSRYPDLDKQVANVGLEKIPHIVHFANRMDNTADVMHELASNPSKIGSLH